MFVVFGLIAPISAEEQQLAHSRPMKLSQASSPNLTFSLSSCSLFSFPFHSPPFLPCCSHLALRSPDLIRLALIIPMSNSTSHELSPLLLRPALDNSSPFRYSTKRLDRQLAKLSLVILADSGKKVYRSDLFFNAEFESFNDDSIQDSEYGESLRLATLAQPQPRRLVSKFRALLQTIRKELRGEVFQSVLKCGLAYLIASLGVYWLPFSRFLGSTDSKHVAATSSVYFHPARTKGSMHQLILFVLLSLSFTFVLSLSCRSISSYYFNVGEDEVSYTIDLVVSSVGLAVIAFMKQKVGRETFNTACSLASISLVTCIVKEGSLNSNTIPMYRLLSTSHVVLMGSLVSVAICYVVWPKSAVTQLRGNLNESFNIMSSLVSVVTHRFVNGEKISAKDSKIFALLRKKITDLSKNLEESKYELYLVGKEREYASYCQIVEATVSLSEHLRALRSSCDMQWQLLLESDGPLCQSSPQNNPADDANSLRSLASLQSNVLPLSQSVENMGNITFQSNLTNTQMDYDAVYSIQLFDLFVYYLAPSIKSFVFTVKEVLCAVPFDKSIQGDQLQSFFVKSSNFQQSLTKAIDLFTEKQKNSFDKLYSQEIFQSKAVSSKTDQEEVAACCGNFSSLLGLFGDQLVRFLHLTEQFELTAKDSRRSWSWVHFWRKPKPEVARRKLTLLEATFVDALRELKLQLKPVQSSPSGDSHHQPSNTPELEQWRLKFWRSLSVFRRTDVQFGFRVGFGAFCISIFAFLPQTQKQFVHYRFEWSLAIYCIMMSKYLGGTNMVAKWRFIGTALGAFIAYVAWQISDANAVVLAITGFFLSLPCFYMIIFWDKNNAFGRFILLTFNLTALYSYSMSQQDSEDGDEGGDKPIVGEIAIHRFVAVSVGVIWALVVANVCLPNSARVRLKSGITVLWLRMGVIWNSDPMEYKVMPEGMKLMGLKDYKGTRNLLLECQVLAKQAPLEFRLKGRFPKETYEQLLKSTSAILDAFLNLQLMLEVDNNLSPNEEYVLRYIESEREELEHRIFLIFYMVASALALGFPLPTKPASTENAKNRMLLKLSEFRTRSTSERADLTNEDFVLLYSYILVTSTITKELDKIIMNIKVLLGDLSEDIFSLV